MSKELEAARTAWIDEVVNNPRKPFKFAEKIDKLVDPTPTSHPDERMHLQLGDIKR